jgi:hypothetical protein
VPVEITYFLLAKEFGWTPNQCDEQPTKKLKGIIHVLSIYNNIKNQEIEKANRKAKQSRR